MPAPPSARLAPTRSAAAAARRRHDVTYESLNAVPPRHDTKRGERSLDPSTGRYRTPPVPQGGTNQRMIIHRHSHVSAAAVGVVLVAAVSLAGTAAAAPGKAPDSPDLGVNVTVFDPSMPVSEIQATLDATHAAQVDNEMGTDRYAFLFEPGTYGTAENPLQIKVGYYTEIAGLGASPTDVVINGKVETYNRCLAPDNCVALVNFWRTLSNLSINVNAAGQDGCRASANFWAVSQASSMRRVAVSGNTLSLMDYCTAGPQFASGGFIADSSLPNTLNGSQQQWLTRNSEIGGWTNGVWNQVFSGVVGAPDDAAFPNPPYTTLDTTPVSREKPYLFVDDHGDYNVRVPPPGRDTSGTTWADGMTPGRTLPISDFFVAKPSDSVQAINNQLARGNTCCSRRACTTSPAASDQARRHRGPRARARHAHRRRRVDPAEGRRRPRRHRRGRDHRRRPRRVAGPAAGGQPARHEQGFGPEPDHTVRCVLPRRRTARRQAGIALEVNSDHVLIDHTWVWRADHGVEGLTDTERWNTNIGRNGVVVNGDNVTANGLFVEHFQQYNTVWNGDDGTTILYQNELPYDPPTQADWMNGSVEGWAGYKVGDGVQTHTLHGGGVYVFNRNNPSIHTENGFEVPDTRASGCTTS